VTEEEWRPVAGAPGYEVSDRGRVKSHKRGGPRLMRPAPNAGGYLLTSLNGKSYYIHRLVALAFLGEPAPGLEVRHLNGDPGDSRLENLAWGTHQENMRDRKDHGRDPQLSKTHCPQRHPYDEANTRVYMGQGRRARVCRACARNWQAEYRAAARALRAANAA
jgi:hypothetical protein